MEEAVYLRSKKALPNRTPTWCSENMPGTFKTYFKDYSMELENIFEKDECSALSILHKILPESKNLSREELKDLHRWTDPNNFKMKSENLKSANEGIKIISNEGIPSTSKVNSPSNSKKLLPLNSKFDCMSQCNGSIKHVDISQTRKMKTKTVTKIKEEVEINAEIPEAAVADFQFVNKFNGSSTVVRNVDSNIEDNILNNAQLEKPVQVSDAELPVINKSRQKNKKIVEANEPAKSNLKSDRESRLKCNDSNQNVNISQTRKINTKTVIKKEKEEVDINAEFPEPAITDFQLPNKRINEEVDVQADFAEAEMGDLQLPDKLNGSSTVVRNESSIKKASITNLELRNEDISDNPVLRLRQELSKIDARPLKRNIKKKRNITGEIVVDTTQREGTKDLIARKHFVVSFRIHKPFKYTTTDQNISTAVGKCYQEIDVLNFQTLTDLREKIVCEMDYQDTSGNISENPEKAFEVLAKDKYKSGMFYIDNTFYVEGAEDYSKVIRKWAHARGIKVGGTMRMDQMRVEDLRVRMGYPYVYKHQGSCEHLVIISNARLLNPTDSLYSSDYPNMTKITRTMLETCQTCFKKPAEWIVYGSERMVCDINLMCEPCFKSFHYIDGKKICNFKAYAWQQRALLFA